MVPRGRPRSFDRDTALDKVMKVFWAKGYECAQINDFTTAIGITPPSFYAAFGNKEQAFREAVDYYRRTIGAAPFDALENATTIQDGLRQWLELSADSAFACPAGGCMISVSSIQCKPENVPVKEFLQAIRHANHERLSKRLQQAVGAGDLPSNADTAQMTEFYHMIQQSISFEARDGNSRAAVQKIIDMAMMALPARTRQAAE
ncbi:TetR/AcrR family transcriptional regulator [Brucella anthropi]|uniref:TetR/AcrR family transcriptional regulator n=1 Tax=Brucella anthropi TaxID=529 RepID=A0A6I0D7Y7_BRUAN|nr:TetR/AcrR family transcriptional regulator [Brucella anthropi]KAB2763103.1 TetR/AcrR family transcriptional regulator [Brucella anthropi]KAB2785365.1 TetR/AcrR family transcriptional regulator [Brucella anthropi]